MGCARLVVAYNIIFIMAVDSSIGRSRWLLITRLYSHRSVDAFLYVYCCRRPHNENLKKIFFFFTSITLHDSRTFFPFRDGRRLGIRKSDNEKR